MKKILLSSLIVINSISSVAYSDTGIPSEWEFSRQGHWNGKAVFMQMEDKETRAYKFSFPQKTPVSKGDYVQIKKNLKLTADNTHGCKIGFWVSDKLMNKEDTGTTVDSAYGTFQKKVLINGQPVWEGEMAEDGSWIEIEKNVPYELLEKGGLEIVLRVESKNAANNVPLEISWSDIELSGPETKIPIELPAQSEPPGEYEEDILANIKTLGRLKVAVMGDSSILLMQILDGAGIKADFINDKKITEEIFKYDILCLARYYVKTTSQETELIRQFVSKGKGLLLTEGTPSYLADGSDLTRISDWLGANGYTIFSSTVVKAREHYVTQGMEPTEMYFPASNAAGLTSPAAGIPLVVSSSKNDVITLLINRYGGGRVGFIWYYPEELVLRLFYWIATGGIYISPGRILIEDEAFQGGYAYSTHKGKDCTWIYGRRTDYNNIKADFYLAELPSGECRLVICGLDDDGEGHCRIDIAVNEETIFKGTNEFPEDKWSDVTFKLKKEILREGTNALQIKNIEDSEATGAPPWFMLSHAEILFD